MSAQQQLLADQHLGLADIPASVENRRATPAVRGQVEPVRPVEPLGQHLQLQDLADPVGTWRPARRGHQVPAPGHTDGSIAVYLAERGVLFTGDTVVSTEGWPIPGVFNVDRPALLDPIRRLSELDANPACFGHTEPFRGDVPAVLAQVASS